MKKRVCAWLLSMAVLFSCAAVFRVPARAAASGEWVLTEVEDTIPENHTQKTEDPPYSRVYSETFHYEPSKYSVDWVSDTTGYDGEKTHEEGTDSIRFSAMPERIRPGEVVTITATVSVTSSGAGMDESGDLFGYTAWAELPQEIPDEAITEGQHRNEYLVPLFAQNFTSSHIISFSMPEADPGTGSVYFDFGMPMGSEDRTFATRYTYKWETGAAPTATQKPEAADVIAIKGLVLSAEAKPMRWMELDAQVYYGQERYDSAKKADAVVKSATDHEGRYSISIPIRGNDTKPVGILLTGTLKCLYPFDGGHEAFYFVDMQDAFSKENNRLAVSTWLSVNPEDYPDTASADSVSVYRLLAFYNLGLGAWSFDAGLEHLMPDPVYLNSSDHKHPERLENYSTLYTAAFDAWFFGAAVLGEAEALVSKPLRVEVRWPVDPAIGASHYNPADHCIRLEEADSLRDDNSRFAILHEFGHAFDLATNGGIFRAYAEYGSDNVNHGGYMNKTTSDSYIEGFATFFAGTVQLYSGYKNPGTLSSIVLADPSLYTAWGRNGKNEEFAIATLLYNAQYLVDDVAAYWSILKEDRHNFYEYYTAIKTYLEGKSPEAAWRLRQYAIDGGLYRMPSGGNGEYDPGEPFRDLAGGIQGQRDANEPYADLMFAVDENGFMDPAKPLHEYDESSLTAGEVSDASRVRKTIEDPPSGFLYLSGETAEYLLVDILPDGEEGSRTLRAVKDGGKVLIGLPDKAMTGTVKVSVPGGNTIYEGDLAVLQRRQAENAGHAVPLAEARIDAADLLKAGIKVAATYGDVNDFGVLSIPDISQNEIVRLSDGYDGDASLDAVTAALVERKGAESDKQSGAGPVLLYIAVGAGFLMIAALVLFAFSGRKRQDVAGLRPSGVCPNCGADLPGGAGFCMVCGQAAEARPKALPVCAGCGASLAHNTAFCSACGRPAPSELPEAHAPLRSPKPRLWLIIAISAAGMAALCVGAHFLFFAGGTPAQSAVKPPATTAVPTVSGTATAQPTPAATCEIVNEKTIKIDIAFDSGEGIYTGEVKDGVPHGQGSFEMKKSDNGQSWSYEGQWRNGDIIGEGVMKQGAYVFSGGFRGGLLNGDCEIKDNGVLRYKGTCKDGKLHGQGTLYTRGGTLLFEGAFEKDMLVESATDREKRGRAFISECDDMDALMYGIIMDGSDPLDYPVAVWGSPIAMGEQKSTGTIVIGHMGEGAYPVCLLYRYGVSEAKMTKDDWINAWGVVIGTYEYKDADGLTVTCPLVEVIYWNNEQEGL
jgi:hypothetical protein